MLAMLLSLIAQVNPALKTGKVPARAAPSFQWTNTHTWIASVAGLFLMLIVFFVVVAVLLWMFRKPRPAQRTRVVESVPMMAPPPAKVAYEPKPDYGENLCMPQTYSPSSMAATALLRSRAMDAVKRWETELDREKLDAAQAVETRWIQKAAAELQNPAPFGPAGKGGP